MSKLIAVRMLSEAPCHLHNCYNPIAYKLVHANYADTLGMEIVMICEACASSLVDSLTPDDVAVEVTALTPKRGRPRKNDVRELRT